MDVECPISGHNGNGKLISHHADLHEQDDEAILVGEDVLVDDEHYQLTELKNVASKMEGNSFLNKRKAPFAEEKVPIQLSESLDSMEPLEELTEDNGELEEDLQGPSDDLTMPRGIKESIQLVHAISQYPTLYNTQDPYFNSKSQKMICWKKVNDFLPNRNMAYIQHEWRNLKERYIKHLQKAGGLMDSEYQPLWNKMRWFDDYLPANIGRNQNHREYFLQDQQHTSAQDVMISGIVSSQPRQSSQSGSEMRQGSSTSRMNQSGNLYLMEKSNNIRIIADNQHTQSAARVTVVPATRTSNGTAVVQLPPGSYPRNQKVQIIHTTGNVQTYDHRVNVGDPGVTVTERGSVARPMHLAKKEQSMIIENGGDFYNNGEQKMYRVMHVDAHGNPINPTPNKRMRMIRTQTPQILSMPPSTSSRHSIPMGTLGEEVVIEDGERIMIDPDVSPDSPLLSESPELGTMMISGQHSGMSGSSPSGHPGYLQQSQYDADLQFQQLISSSLARHNEEDKAVLKFHIQRILLDARFGQNIAKQLLQDVEEENVNVVPRDLS